MTITLDDFDGHVFDGLEFCAKAYALFEEVRAAPDGVKHLRLWQGPIAKRLIEELLPICRYIQTYYRLGRYISVRWVNGSQSYDAELHQRGEYVRQGYFSPLAYLEATCAMHENEHWIGKLLDEGRPVYAPEGITKVRGKPVESEPIVFSNAEHVHNFVPIVTSLIKKKSAISYPENTSLVIQCHLNCIYMPDEWQLLVSEVQRNVATAPFREVLMFDGTTERATALTLRSE